MFTSTRFFLLFFQFFLAFASPSLLPASSPAQYVVNRHCGAPFLLVQSQHMDQNSIVLREPQFDAHGPGIDLHQGGEVTMRDPCHEHRGRMRHLSLYLLVRSAIQSSGGRVKDQQVDVQFVRYVEDGKHVGPCSRVFDLSSDFLVGRDLLQIYFFQFPKGFPAFLRDAAVDRFSQIQPDFPSFAQGLVMPIVNIHGTGNGVVKTIALVVHAGDTVHGVIVWSWKIALDTVVHLSIFSRGDVSAVML